MSVSEILEYDKDGEVVQNPRFRRLFLAIVIILVAALAFGVGRLSAPKSGGGVSIEYIEGQETSPGTNNNQAQQASVLNAAKAAGGVGAVSASKSEVVASKNGQRYHFAHCAGAKQIKEENKIVFASPQAAEAAGYTLAANCSPK